VWRDRVGRIADYIDLREASEQEREDREDLGRRQVPEQTREQPLALGRRQERDERVRVAAQRGILRGSAAAQKLKATWSRPAPDIDGLVDRQPMPELGRRLLVVLLPLLSELLLVIGALLGNQLERRRVTPELLELKDEAVELLEDDESLPAGQRLALRCVLHDSRQGFDQRTEVAGARPKDAPCEAPCRRA
jgi:hypothetical protein